MTDLSENSKAARISTEELRIILGGKKYRINGKTVVEAFDRAGYGDSGDPHVRYFVRVDGELKSVESVFGKIVPIERKEITPELADEIAHIFEVLGFEILDRDKHHGR